MTASFNLLSLRLCRRACLSSIAIILALAFATSASAENYVEDGIFYVNENIEDLSVRDTDTSVTKIVVGPNVTSLGTYAFYNYTALTEVDFSNASSLTTIGDCAFFFCTALTSVDIPASVKSIGVQAFSGCVACSSITFQEGSQLRFIGEKAFSSAPITTITIPQSVNEVGANIFLNCRSLTSCHFQEGSQLSSINNFCFDFCTGLVDVTLPAALKEICYGAFRNCTALENITIPEGVTTIGDKAFQNCSSLKSISIPSGVTTLGKYAFADCVGLQSAYIPIKTIPDYAFYMSSASKNSALAKVEIPYATSIGSNAFAYCKSLSEIVLPESLSQIGEKAFYYCTGLKKILSFATIVPSMAAQASNSSSRQIFVPDAAVASYTADTNWSNFGSIQSMNNYPFEVNGIFYLIDPATHTATVTYDFLTYDSIYDDWYPVQSLDIPATINVNGNEYTVTAIADKAFYYCKTLQSVALPASITSIGSSAFYECTNLQSVNIPEGVTKIPDSAFLGCSSLTSIDLPSSIQAIESKAFYGCTGITEISLPDALIGIGSQAFYNCSGLSIIHFGANITNISSKAFMGCDNISKITIDALTPPTIIPPSDSYNSTFPTATYYYTVWVKDEAYSTYTGDTNWSTFNIKVPAIMVDNICYRLDRKTATATVIANEDGGYAGDIVIPQYIDYEDTRYTVTTIDNGAFIYCDKVSSIDFRYVTSIGDAAFEGTNITSADFSNVEVFGSMICAGCSSLTDVKLPDGLVVVPKGMFYKCFNLKSIILPGTVTEIGAEAFIGAGLVSISLPPRTRYIDSCAFASCEDLKFVEFPSGLRVIDESAFDGAIDLKTIQWYDSESFENESEKIVAKAPARASAIDPASLTYHLTTIGRYAFSRTGLTYFYVPKTVEKSLTIDTYAFASTAIAHLDVAATNIPALDVDGFDYETYNTSLIFVPDEMLEAYKSDKSWGQFKCYPTANETQMYVFADEAETAVYYAGEVTDTATGDFTVPDVVTDGTNSYDVVAISAAALRNSDITSAELPSSIISLGNSAFEGCQSLQSVKYRDEAHGKVAYRIPKANIRKASTQQRIEGVAIIPAIGKNAFADCSALTSVELPADIESIPDNAFRNCSALTTVEIPSTVYYIAEAAFMGSGITAITIPENVSEVAPRAFKNCTSLATINMPDKLNYIAPQAFRGCTALKEITLPATLNYIGTEAFADTDFETVTSLNPEPPYVEGKTAFSNETYANARLFIPINADKAYSSANVWSLFKKIGITTAVDAIDIDTTDTDSVEYYNLNGIKVANPTPGIYICRKNGLTAKVVIK